ncbi:hypothetical protein [Methylomonas methanica]|uniref:hypothetical protein n=1 Tax=Methylomonas methanica TaxID=421 RepID=UPI0012F6695C|nr:hypothetical protein [Methylomonas methanica]
MEITELLKSQSRGFIFSGGQYNTFSLSSYNNINTYAQGLNDIGQVVGYYDNSSGRHGFIYSIDSGIYLTIDVPHVFDRLDNSSNSPINDTYVEGINNKGQVVGYYYNATGYHGFIYDTSTDTYNLLINPNAANGYTLAFGINDNGQIVGIYPGGSAGGGFSATSGFVATPTTVPLPSAFWFFGTAFITGIFRHNKNYKMMTT